MQCFVHKHFMSLLCFQEGIMLNFLDVKEDSKEINLSNVMTQAHPNDTMVGSTRIRSFIFL